MGGGIQDPIQSWVEGCDAAVAALFGQGGVFTQAQGVAQESGQGFAEGEPFGSLVGLGDLFHCPEQMGEAYLASRGLQPVVGCLELRDENPGKQVPEEVGQDRRTAGAVDHIAGQRRVGEAPEPMSDPIDPAAGLIGLQVGALPGLIHEIDVPGVEDLGEPLPHLDEASGGQGEVEVHVEKIEDVGGGHAHAVMKPAGERQGAVSNRGPGQGVRDDGFHDFLAGGTPGAVDDVPGHLRFLVRDVSDEPLAGTAGAGYRIAALRADLQAVLLGLGDGLFGEGGSAGARMPFLAARLFSAPFVC